MTSGGDDHQAREPASKAGSDAPRTTRRSRRGRLAWRWLLIAYLTLLVASHLHRTLLPATPDYDHLSSLELPEVRGEKWVGPERVRITYRDIGPTELVDNPDALPALLIHGSPGNMESLEGMATLLGRQRRVIVVDLPGFGGSTRDIPDYSILAHARYCEELLRRLEIPKAHLVGFSMGGGVVLHMADRTPKATASVTLLAAIGVQELELLGDYHLNHAVHGLQAAALWAIQELVPHFGLLDHSFFGFEYARNFFDTDQRPLRDVLLSYGGPMLIVHGENDMLVPATAALEHHRLVPQSELAMLDRNHFFVFTEAELAAEPLANFMARADSGQVQRRRDTSLEARRQAQEPFDPSSIPPAAGFPLLVMLFSIAAATLVSEDLTCIGAGLLVAAGRLSFFHATLACAVGIFVGDMMLYAAGRMLGSPALSRPPLSWMITPSDVRRSARWFDRKGLAVIFLSRFLPGARLPTYFAAGLFRASFLRFTLYFLVAVAVWTPILVGLATLGGEQARQALDSAGELSWLLLGAVVLVLLLGTRVLLPSLTYRGRRLLRGKVRRITRWEYWPLWVFYPPVALWILWLGLRYRSLSLPTCVNPAFPAGGVVGESKLQILDVVRRADARRVPVYRRLPRDPDDALAAVRAFVAEHQLNLPLVLKPERGERGSGVIVARTWSTVEDVLRRHAATAERDPEELFADLGSEDHVDAAPTGPRRSLHNEPRSDVDLLVQEYVSGPELGVFWLKEPDTGRGQVFAITEKVLPTVVGDGRRSLEKLILAENSLLAMAHHYLAFHDYEIERIPDDGEVVTLTELGTHCRGAIFLDGERFRTPELEAAVDELSLRLEGVDFGRYDLKGDSEEALRAGRFRVLELNGVTSEATHIYDPAYSVLHAYRVLFAQWRWAFRIGHHNRQQGLAKPIGFFNVLRMVLSNRAPET